MRLIFIKELEKLEQSMDLREKFYKYLIDFRTKNNFIPAKYGTDKVIMANLREYEEKGTWRKRPEIVKKIRRAAALAEKNVKRRIKANGYRGNYKEDQVF